jgi:hypothetical protein
LRRHSGATQADQTDKEQPQLMPAFDHGFGEGSAAGAVCGFIC